MFATITFLGGEGEVTSSLSKNARKLVLERSRARKSLIRATVKITNEFRDLSRDSVNPTLRKGRANETNRFT